MQTSLAILCGIMSQNHGFPDLKSCMCNSVIQRIKSLKPMPINRLTIEFLPFGLFPTVQQHTLLRYRRLQQISVFRIMKYSNPTVQVVGFRLPDCVTIGGSDDPTSVLDTRVNAVEEGQCVPIPGSQSFKIYSSVACPAGKQADVSVYSKTDCTGQSKTEQPSSPEQSTCYEFLSGIRSASLICR